MSEERVFGPGSQRGKGYTSTGTTIKRIAVFAVILIILAVIYFAVAPLNRAIRLTFEKPSGGEKYAVLTSKGLSLSGTNDLLPLESGKEPYAVMSGETLVVANRLDMKVAFVSPEVGTNWVDVPQVFGESDRILRLFPASEGVYVVVQDMSDTASVRAASRPTGTTLVKFNGTSEPVSSEMAIEPSLMSPASVRRTSGGKFTWDEGGQPTDLATLPDAVFWATDFEAKVVAAAEDKSVVIINNGKKFAFTPALAHKITDIRVRTDLKEVWVSVAKPGGGTGVLAYDYNGGFKAIRANSKESLYGPFAPNSQAVEALLASSK